MLNKKEILALKVLEQCRTDLINDFKVNEPEIYTPSFKYERSPALLKLAREKYFTAWLSSHWQSFNQYIDQFSTEEQREAEKYFSCVFLKLLKKWSTLKTTDEYQLDLGQKLITDMVISLNYLINLGDKSEANRNQLEVTLEKNRVLFDREFKQLSKEKE